MYVRIINCSSFKLCFTPLFNQFGIKLKPTTVKNHEANAILERLNGALCDMFHKDILDDKDHLHESNNKYFIMDADWVVGSPNHVALGLSPRTAMFDHNILFDLPYMTNWMTFGREVTNTWYEC